MSKDKACSGHFVIGRSRAAQVATVEGPFLPPDLVRVLQDGVGLLSSGELRAAIKARLRQADEDPCRSIAAADVFDRLQLKHARRGKI